MDAIDRIKEFIDKNNMSEGDFGEKIGVSQRSMNYYLKRKQKPSYKFIENVINVYGFDPYWLITGEDKIKKIASSSDISSMKQSGYSPYFSELSVSAGQYNFVEIEQKETPESYIKIPGVSAKYWFPIVGCSMEPKVFPGDTIGVIDVDDWEKVDPDKTYLVITREDRMIKHLVVDEEKKDFLWAVSENYPRFKVYTVDILRIFRVVWAGRLV